MSPEKGPFQRISKEHCLPTIIFQGAMSACFFRGKRICVGTFWALVTGCSVALLYKEKRLELVKPLVEQGVKDLSTVTAIYTCNNAWLGSYAS